MFEERKGCEGHHDGPCIPLPLNKLSLPTHSNEATNLVVLVETGSFNPPTYMHLQMFDAGREALENHGLHVLGGYISPVNNGYGKQGLIPAEHRIRMCELAVEGSELLMVDPWEALQPMYQRTSKVLARVAYGLHDLSNCLGSIRIMLLCGADLLESFTIPGVWIPDQVETICRDYGLVCLKRGGRNLRTLIQECDLLSKYKENIFIIDNFESEISSTRVRENLANNLPVDDLTPACVIDYIKSNGFYQLA